MTLSVDTVDFIIVGQMANGKSQMAKVKWHDFIMMQNWQTVVADTSLHMDLFGSLCDKGQHIPDRILAYFVLHNLNHFTFFQ